MKVSLKHFLDVLLKVEWLECFAAAMLLDFTVGINKELVEVPFDVFDFSLLLEIDKDWMSCGSINLDFFKNWEVDAEIFPHFFFDDLNIFGLLFELVRWESNDLESLFAILLAELNELFIVLSSMAAFGSNVNNHSTFGVLEILAQSSLRCFTILGMRYWKVKWLRGIFTFETRSIFREILLLDLFSWRFRSSGRVLLTL